MRIYELFSGLIQRFTPMDKTQEQELQLEAVKFYGTIKDENIGINENNKRILRENTERANEDGYVTQSLQKKLLKHRVVEFLEQWWVRYLIALLFVYLLPKIKAYINGEGDSDGEDSEQSEQEEMMQFYQMYKSMKRHDNLLR